MRRTRMVIAGAVVAAVLSACGGNEAGEGGGSAGQGGNAEAGTGEAGTGEGTSAVAAPAKDLETLVRQLSETTAAKQTVSFTMESGDGKNTLSGEGKMQLSATEPAIQLNLETSGEMPAAPSALGGSETIAIGAVNYFKDGKSESKPWVKLDLGKQVDSPFLALINAAGEQSKRSADPAKTFKQLKVGGTLAETAQETVDGAQTTKYTVRVDTKKIADATDDKLMRSLMQFAAKAGVTDYPVLLWVGQDGLPVRMRVQTPLPNFDTGGAAGQQKQQITTVNYQGWGEPVSIKAPPAGQVRELKLPDLSKLGRAGAGGGRGMAGFPGLGG